MTNCENRKIMNFKILRNLKNCEILNIKFENSRISKDNEFERMTYFEG